MTVRTYWAWETTATLHLLGGARDAGAPTGEGRGAGAYRVATRTACYPANLCSLLYVACFFFSQFVHHEVEHKGVAVSAVSLFVWLTFRAITWKKYGRWFCSTVIGRWIETTLCYYYTDRWTTASRPDVTDVDIHQHRTLLRLRQVRHRRTRCVLLPGQCHVAVISPWCFVITGRRRRLLS